MPGTDAWLRTTSGFIAVVAILTSFACLVVLILSASAAMVPRVAASHADAAA